MKDDPTPRDIAYGTLGVAMGLILMWVVSVIVNLFTDTWGFIALTTLFLLFVMFGLAGSIRKAIRKGVI